MKVLVDGNLVSEDEAIAFFYEKLKDLKCWEVAQGGSIKRVWVVSGRLAKAYTFVSSVLGHDDFSLIPLPHSDMKARRGTIIKRLILRRDWDGWVNGDDIVCQDIEVPDEWRVFYVVGDKQYSPYQIKMAKEAEAALMKEQERKQKVENDFFKSVVFVNARGRDHKELYVAVMSGDFAKAEALLNDMFGARTSLDGMLQASVSRTETVIYTGNEYDILKGTLSEAYIEGCRERGVFRVRDDMVVIDDITEEEQEPQPFIRCCLVGSLF